MKNTQGAFLWITEILERHGIPFQISGGFAARVYGSERELADIDIDYSESRLPEFLSEIEAYIVYGPMRYEDDTFDLHLTTLEYQGQEIDLAGCETGKLFNKATGKWVQDDVDFTQSEEHEIFEKKVKVIGKQKLIEYKSWIRRDVDLEDLKQLGALATSEP